MEINLLINKIKKYIKIFIMQKIKYKYEILKIYIEYRNVISQDQKKEISKFVYDLHDELLYLSNTYKLLSKLYI